MPVYNVNRMTGMTEIDRYDSDEVEEVATDGNASGDASLHSSGSDARHSLDYLCDLQGNFFS